MTGDAIMLFLSIVVYPGTDAGLDVQREMHRTGAGKV